jgi:hypothetical protein
VYLQHKINIAVFEVYNIRLIRTAGRIRFEQLRKFVEPRTAYGFLLMAMKLLARIFINFKNVVVSIQKNDSHWDIIEKLVSAHGYHPVHHPPCHVAKYQRESGSHLIRFWCNNYN